MPISAACIDDRHNGCFGFASEGMPSVDLQVCECTCHTRTRYMTVDGERFGFTFDGENISDDQFGRLREFLTAEARRVRNGESYPGKRFDITDLLDPHETEPRQRSLWPDDGSVLPPPHTADEYQRQAVRTAADQPDVNERLKFGSMGMGAESGEVLNLVYKTAYQGHPWTEEQRRKLIEEVGDVLWFCAYTLDAVHCGLMEAMQANNAKLRRRYGAKFSPAKSIARRDVQKEDEATS